jgi:hypothetical protein
MRVSALRIATFASAAFVAATMFSVVPCTNGTVSIGVEEAQARVGRPATATSVAGVARRTTRRTVRRTTVGVGAAAAGAAVVAPRCGYHPYPPCY